VTPLERVLVRVVRLEYSTVVVHNGKEIVVALGRGIGGQIRVIPGIAVTRSEAEFQMSGSIYTVPPPAEPEEPEDPDEEELPSSDCRSTAQSEIPRKPRLW
jgi:hypothetical protein